MQWVQFTGALSMAAHLTGLIMRPSENWPRLAVAGGLYAASLWIFWWTACTTRSPRLAIAFSPHMPDQIVQTGPFRWVRHPFYLSYMLAWLAGGVGVAWPWAWLALPIMGAQYLHAIRHEERQFLAGPLAEDYREYITKVGMLMPRVDGHSLAKPQLQKWGTREC